MKKLTTAAVVVMTSLLSVADSNAGKVYDFEDCQIGQKFDMWNEWGYNPDGASAIVEADPANPANKVLHVIVKSWGTFPEFILPDELAGSRLTQNVRNVEFDFYRPSTDTHAWKQVHVYLGNEQLYISDGYPDQGSQNVWQHRKYELNKVETAGDDEVRLHLGIHHEDSEYYLDNVALKDIYEDYIIAEGQTVDYCEKNTSSSYKIINTPMLVPEGQSLNVKTSRYTYWTSVLEGSGTLNVMAGGERTFIGGSDKNYPKWSDFTGTLNIYPYKEVDSSCGFYGMVWMHNGKTFLPNEPMESVNDGKVNNCLANATLVVNDGATLAAEGGIRGMRIGKLVTKPGSCLQGYYKEKASNHSFYMIGGNGMDAELEGRIAPCKDNMSMKVGLIKEGSGTYRITVNDNLLTGGITVLDGAVMVNNDAVEARQAAKSGGVGYMNATEEITVNVREKGLLGGTGNIGVTTDVYGKLAPGDQSVATLAIADYTSHAAPRLILRPTSQLLMEVKNKDEHDRIDVGGVMTYYNKDEDFNTSDKKPILAIRLADGASLAVGDEMVLLSAAGKQSLTGEPWEMDIRYPNAYTWKVEEREVDGRLEIVATVVAEEYGNQPGESTDGDGEEDNPVDDTSFDIEAEKVYESPLRDYATRIGEYVGTAVPVWRIDVDNDNDAKTAKIAKEFNMVVCENEMKFDSTEPNRGEFNWYHGDRIVNFCDRHDMRLRGHTLVWHSQVPAWLTTDGNKNSNNFSREELLSIMKNHIVNVVGRWKGKVNEWDVCNEVLSDDQSAVYSNPDTYTMRPSVWMSIGEDFLDSAFVWAHRKDPNALLILNDYGVEFKGNAKAEAFFNLAKKLKERGAPIDGVGLQCHLDINDVDYAKLEATMQRFEEIGLKCIITELDLGIPEVNEWNLAQQANDYYNICKLAMKYGNCDEVMIWGLTDDMSWRTGSNPLLYDGNLNPKPAYWGVHAALRQAVQEAEGDDPSGVDELSNTDSPVTSVKYYSLYGAAVGADFAGPVIRVTTHKDGSRTVSKIMRSVR